MAEYLAVIAGWESGAGAWGGGAHYPVVGSSLTTRSAYTFEVPVTLASGRDIALDPPTFQDLGLDLYFYGPPGVPGDRQANVYLIADPNPPQFDAVNKPTVQEAEYGRELVGTYYSEAYPPGPFSIELDLGAVFSVYRNSGWQGRLNFVVNYWFVSSPTYTLSLGGTSGTLTHAKMVSEELPFITGVSGPVEKWARVDRCGKCGRLDTVDHFVEDGWSKGLLVCRECWDPEEPPAPACSIEE